MILSMTRGFLNGFAPLEGGPGLSSPNPARYRMLAALWEHGQIFTPEALRAMRLLVPHLDRAVRLQVRNTSPNLRADLLSGVLDALTLGVLLIDAGGLPLCVNRRAHEITERSNALQLGHTGLVAASRSDNQSLRELISKAISAGSQGVLAIGRGIELRPLLLIAIPLKAEAKREMPADAPRCAIFISDPDRADNPSVEALRCAFDLTYREAQTAIAVANGHGLKVAAKSMGVALTTARSQLQQAFAKTGTRQQAELAALVHRTLAQLRFDRSAGVTQVPSRNHHKNLLHSVSLPDK
jgi:DNA-binding NarL/FixJ family response regulator